MLKIIQSIAVFALSLAFAGPNMHGGEGPLRAWSAKTMGHLKLNVGVSGRGSPDEAKISGNRFLHAEVVDSIPQVDPNGTEIDEVLDVTFRAFAAIGYTDYFDIGMALPIHADYLRKARTVEHVDLQDARGVGLGDLEVWGKLQYPPYEHNHIFDMAFLGMLTFPTGSKDKGFIPKETFYIPVDESEKTRFFSADAITAKVMMLWTLDFEEWLHSVPVYLHLNYGLHSTFSDKLGNSFVLNSAVIYSPNQIFDVFLEFSGQTRLSRFNDGFDIGRDPLYLTPGFKVNSPEGGLSFTVAFDKGLSTRSSKGVSELRLDADPSDGKYTTYKTIPTPNWGFSAVLAWSGFVLPQDSDSDGIKDGEDACPDHPEDIDSFDDHDGCPDNDNDQDEIEDQEDKCPMVPEDLDGFEDEDGCPDLDNDKDNIPDLKDKCPMEPEEVNGLKDKDGCPESTMDKDKDGISDLKDLCFTEPEDLDGFEDEDGCPDFDNDQDGFKDDEDRCPLRAESINQFEDEDGCPDVDKQLKVLGLHQAIILYGVGFVDGDVNLMPNSYPVLEEIIKVLVEDPALQVEVQSFVSRSGDDEKDLTLSKQRANLVKELFIENGVAKGQLKTKGIGSQKPKATDRTPEGRATNNRIELIKLQ